ncbi:PREDICTED: uncharacterized protein LOC107065783 [Polistes dominula]|uniref:Uncharacterized protein LOC107065783 n=1 Tax=Polistes dominula TaxID=743375 RepID=A0ABM1I4W4_POLDO|nr:PREDICTED: uncharacterized protein LOC107065783 [Polistes dominula]
MFNDIKDDGFFEEEPMCKAIDLSNDTRSLKTSMKIIYKKLLDMQSCCAIKEGDNKIVGVAIASINFMGDHVRSETRVKVDHIFVWVIFFLLFIIIFVITILIFLLFCSLQLHQGDAIFNIMSMKSCVFSKARPYDRLQIEQFFRIHLLYVNKDNRNKGIGTALISCCIDLARNLLAPACIGGFSSTITQIIGNNY